MSTLKLSSIGRCFKSNSFWVSRRTRFLEGRGFQKETSILHKKYIGTTSNSSCGSLGSIKPLNNTSHLSGPLEPPLWKKTVGELFDQNIAQNGNVLALISEQENIQWNYTKLGIEVTKLIAGLTKLGIERGERVGIYMPNVAAWVVFQYALAKLGAILVPLNPAFRACELAQIIRLAKLKALVAVPKYKNSNYVDIICSIIPEVRENKGEINCKDFPHLHHIIFASDELSLPPGAVNLKSLMEDSAAAEPNIELPNLDTGDIINIQFTSGTTGTPKGVALTHDNIVNNARFVAERQRLTKGDVVCIPVPLYHCFGIVMGNLACLAEGATALFPSPTFEPGSSLASVEKHGAVALYGVPTMFTAMLQHPQFQKVDLSSLRTGIMAGSPCPISVMEKVTKFIPAITVCYGMTETGPVSFQTLPNSPIEARTSTVGCIMPHTHSRVLKLRGNEAALIGETGRLQIKGYLVMHSYWNDDESTKKVIDAEGWMDTGDLASIDKEGYCRIVGRSKDMVIRGGENIYPTEIENLLLRHPSILDVSVIGVPDEKFGEELCAFYIPSDKPVPNHGFREEFKGSFAHYKIPIYFISVDKFPTTVSGKVKKFELRKMALARLNLSSSKN